MASKRRQLEEIVTKLWQVEVLHGQGMTMADAICQIGVSELTFYRWRKQYDSTSRDELHQLQRSAAPDNPESGSARFPFISLART